MIERRNKNKYEIERLQLHSKIVNRQFRMKNVR